MRKLRIAVVGLGKLGLPLAAVLANSKFSVLGIDIDPKQVNSLRLNKFNFSEPHLNVYLKKNKSRLNFSANFDDIKNIDVAYLIVPTPSDKSGFFLNDFLIDAIREIGKAWHNAKHIRTLVIVSTVMPGATRNVLIPVLETAVGEKCGDSLQVIYSPEFIAIGSVIKDLSEPDILLIGSANKESIKQHLAIMKTMIKTKVATRILNFEEAELVKLLINNFITTKVTFANQISEFTDFIPGTSPGLIAEAIGNDSRIGNKYLKPGLGFGGPCFPRDTKALSALAQVNNWNSEIAIAVDETNQRQPQLMAKRIFSRYKNLKAVGVYGLAYKKGASITEESQAIMFANEMAKFGLQVVAYDPLITARPEGLNEAINYVTDIVTFLNTDLLICTQPIIFKDELQLSHLNKHELF